MTLASHLRPFSSHSWGHPDVSGILGLAISSEIPKRSWTCIIGWSEDSWESPCKGERCGKGMTAKLWRKELRFSLHYFQNSSETSFWRLGHIGYSLDSFKALRLRGFACQDALDMRATHLRQQSELRIGSGWPVQQMRLFGDPHLQQPQKLQAPKYLQFGICANRRLGQDHGLA